MTNTTSLKSKATIAMLWSAVEKFSVQGGQFIIGVLLARILMPEDFGLIGMLSILIVLSQSIVDSGMGAGLIQKKKCTGEDFSTVFIFNLAISLGLYLVLYIFAPSIAGFYEKSELISLTRVLSLNVIINSFSIIQRSKLTIDIDFKTIAKVNVVSVIGGGIIAIYFAYNGFGVWSLVIQNITRSALSVIMFWLFGKWMPILSFSVKSFKELFGFGSKILISNLYARSFQEVYNIIIGKFYSAAELGFYTNGKKFADISAGTVTAVLQQVTFPVMASLQDDKKRLVSAYRRIIKMTAFFIFPAMTLLALLADPFIRILLTDKWVPTIVLFQWMCFARIVTPISVVNMNILNAIGRSDLFLKVDLSKLPLIVLALLITIPMGVKAIVIGHVVTSAISFFINAYIPGKLFGYGALQQLKDMVNIIIATIAMSLTVIILTSIINNLFLELILGITVGFLAYFFICSLLKISEVDELYSLLEKLKRKI